MKTHFLCLAFVWLLPLKASSAVTSGLNHNPTNVTAGGVTPTRFYREQQTMQQMPALARQSETSGLDITPSTIADFKTRVDTTRTMTHERFITNNQTAETPVGNRSRDSNDSVNTIAVKSEAITPTMFPTHEASNPTKPSTVPPMVSNPSQTQSTGKISTSRVSRDEMTYPSSPSTQPILTSTASIKPEDQSTSTRPVTGGDAARSSTTSTHITKPTKRDNSNNGGNPSKIVAGLIGGALLLMMVGFLVIYIQRKQFQKQQITTDWAGPSPFLSGGDNGQVTLRSSNRISLYSFLPQRLSKRLSLLPEMDEELQDMTPSSFEGKHQENTFGQAVDGKDAQAKNRSPAVTQENGVSEANNVQQTNNSEAANLIQDAPVQPSNPSGGEENAQAKSE